MPEVLKIYTSRPEGLPAQVYAQYLAAKHKLPIQVLPLSAMPAPPSRAARRREQLLAEKEELRQTLGGLEMGLALAATDPYRYASNSVVWQQDKARHEGRLAELEWEIAQLQEGGPASD